MTATTVGALPATPICGDIRPIRHDMPHILRISWRNGNAIRKWENNAVA